MDATPLVVALIGAIVTIIGLWNENRKLRTSDLEKKVEEGEAARVTLRLREMDSIEEFYGMLRERVKEQDEKISRLETHVANLAEKRNRERLEHERERLEWYGERIGLRERIARLEGALNLAGLPPPEAESA